MDNFRELAEEIAKLSPIRDRLVTIISEALSHQYERGVKDGYEKGFREAKQYGEVYEQELKKIVWNEAVEACKKVADNIVIEVVGNSKHTANQIAESIGKLRRE